MSRYLGENLVVDLSVKEDEERIVNLADLLNENPGEIVTVVGTVDEEGRSHTTPIALVMARDEETMLVTVHSESTTAGNLHRDGRVCIEVITEGDVAVGIKGSAEVLRDSMRNHGDMSLWSVQIEEVKQDTSPVVRVTDGISFEVRSERGAEFERSMVEEMREFIED